MPEEAGNVPSISQIFTKKETLRMIHRATQVGIHQLVPPRRITIHRTDGDKDRVDLTQELGIVAGVDPATLTPVVGGENAKRSRDRMRTLFLAPNAISISGVFEARLIQIVGV